MTNYKTDRHLLLISNSTLFGRGYLDHAEDEIRELMGAKTRIAFIPYALHDRRGYTQKAEERFREMGLSLTSTHDLSNMPRAIDEADAVFIGGGNTFRLLTALHDYGLLEPIRRRIAGGTPYIGSSAGSIVACPTLKTTKDMPIVQPPSF
jgi:dipeptidase E